MGISVLFGWRAVIERGNNCKSQRSKHREKKPEAGLAFGTDNEEATEQVEGRDSCEHSEEDKASQLIEHVPIADVVGVPCSGFRVDEAEQKSANQHDNWDHQQQEKRE